MYNRSNKPNNKATSTQMLMTVMVYFTVSLLVGQVIFFISLKGPPKKLDKILLDFIVVDYQKEA